MLATSVAVRLALSAILLVLVALLDIATGNEISFAIFYLFPVTFAVAFISRRAGFVLSLVSAATWGYVEVATGRGYSAAWIPYWNSAVRLGFFLIVNELVDHLRRAHAVQRSLAREDSLTRIANMRVFQEHAQRAIALCRRSKRVFTVAYIDLDEFKRVNDKFGHSEGDALLQTVAQHIVQSSRSTDVAARLGGDEFGILMPDTNSAQARIGLDRIAAAITGGIGDRWAVKATIGAVTFTEPPEDVDHAVREADALMYRGKTEGRGRILQADWPPPAVTA